MATNWRVQPFGELTDNFDSVRVPVKEADRTSGPYPYYGASGIVDHVNEYLFDGKYLLVAEDGENLRTRTTPVAFLATGKFWVNNHAHIVTGNAKSDTQFLMYFLNASDIGGYLSGSTMPKLTQGNLNRIPVSVPSLPEQRAIANVLGALDDKIHVNRRVCETLEAMAGALFKSWFVDFGAVYAKAEGRDPELPRQAADLFQNSRTRSDGGEIPQGWSITRLGELTAQRRDLIDPRDAPEDEFDHFSLPAFDDDQRPQPQLGADIKSVKYRIPRGSVLVSKLNPAFPRVWLVEPELHLRPICSTEFLVLVPKPPATMEYLYCLLTSEGFRSALRSLATGTSGSHQRARPDDVLDLPIVRPPSDVIAEFSGAVTPMLERGLVAKRESRTLASLRDTLLPKLISGELRVPDAERIAVEAGA